MTSKIYRTAQGKTVDLGTIMLQNEHVRAVGNMKVNARGDRLDSNNQVIETKSQQIQNQNNRTTTNVSSAPVHTSSKRAKRRIDTQAQIDNGVSATPVVDSAPDPVDPVVDSTPAPTPVAVAPVAPAPQARTKPAVAPAAKQPAPVQNTAVPPPKSPAAGANNDQPSGGLASAIARSREVKQELDRTRRQQAQDQGVRKI
jgi:outer membrane murein-binding lipoprotein Lpp